MVLISSSTRPTPRAAIFSGVSAIANRVGVALFTPASVACADSTTATSRVKGLMYWSSPFGAGWAAANRSKIASVLAALACRDSRRAMTDLYARRPGRQVDDRRKAQVAMRGGAKHYARMRLGHWRRAAARIVKSGGMDDIS